jgi:UDP-N-acetylmuramoylalanine--D-glutamate ligase
MTTETALVYGIAIAGEAVARALVKRGYRVILADDTANEHRRAVASELGTDLIEAPDHATIERLVRSADLVVPSPGVPETHGVVRAAIAADVALRSEIDLAYDWEQQRPGGPRPMIAITGTDGKTTTTMLAAALLTAGGLRTAAVGNTEVPFVTALDADNGAAGGGFDAFAVECSSFRLAWITSFRAEAAIWLNLAPDHQNWHTSMQSYEMAKANVWRHQRASDVAIGWAGDPTVMRHLRGTRSRRVTFALADADYHVTGEHIAGRAQREVETRRLTGPHGDVASVASLARRFPHDLTNALAASAACIEAGLVAPDRIDAGLAAFRVPPHRIEPVATIDGVQWFNDSKATSPHAALTAIRSFDSIVLIAGGRNKGLDLSSLGSEIDRIRSVVAIGESAADIEAVFAGRRPVERASSMAEAVEIAAHIAAAPDVVLLSPACASFDWYPDGGYPARGDDFRRLAIALAARIRSTVTP